MNNKKITYILDILIYIFFNMFLILLIIQLHNSNYRYSIINNIYLPLAYGIFLLLFTANSIILYKLKFSTIFRLNIFLQFYLIYIFAISTCSGISILYAPIIMLIISIFYPENKFYFLHLLSYLGILSGNVIFVIISALLHSNNANHITKLYIIHLLLCLFLSGIITKTSNLSIKTILHKKLPKEDNALEILSITATDNNYNNNLSKLTSNVSSLINNTTNINSIINDIKYNMSIASSDSKSITSLSSKLQKDIDKIEAVAKELETISHNIKSNFISMTDSLNSLVRTNLLVNSSNQNLMCNLSDINYNRETLENILIELDNLSIVTTHLANSSSIEVSNQVNIDVLNHIVKEFNAYSKDIRTKINNITNVSNNLNKSYYSCESELINSNNLLASNNLIISDLYDTLDTLNLKFNQLLVNTSTLDEHIDLAHSKSRNITADSSELENALYNCKKKVL